MNGGIQITALVKQKVIIPHNEFPRLLSAHLARNKNTASLETRGQLLRTTKTLNWDEVKTFIREVCRWGDYAAIADRVLDKENNSQEAIIHNFEDAISHLNATPPEITHALKSMLKIKELGVSFASKHLRFLLPEFCPVLDSILSQRLFYESSVIGYKSFAATCTDIAAELNQAGIASPFPSKSSWRPSDVEAALFAWANEWS
jgi:hypothetical protein